MFTSRRRGRKQTYTQLKGAFDPNAPTVTHEKIGIWEKYTEKRTISSKSWPFLDAIITVVESLPSIWQMLKDLASVRECTLLSGIYILLQLVISLIPATKLTYRAQLLEIVSVQRSISLPTP